MGYEIKLSEDMVRALEAMPLVRLWGGYWVAKKEGMDPMATKGVNRVDKLLEGIERHRTVTVRALRERGLVKTHSNLGRAGTEAWLSRLGRELVEENRGGR